MYDKTITVASNDKIHQEKEKEEGERYRMLRKEKERLLYAATGLLQLSVWET